MTLFTKFLVYQVCSHLWFVFKLFLINRETGMCYFVVRLPWTFQNVCNLDTNEKTPSTSLEYFPSHPAQWLTDASAPTLLCNPALMFSYIHHTITGGCPLPIGVGKRGWERFHAEGFIWARLREQVLERKDIPVRGNHTKYMIILVWRPKAWPLMPEGHGLKHVWLFSSYSHDPIPQSSLTTHLSSQLCKESLNCPCSVR